MSLPEQLTLTNWSNHFDQNITKFQPTIVSILKAFALSFEACEFLRPGSTTTYSKESKAFG
jgi:hypothetical protein